MNENNWNFLAYHQASNMKGESEPLPAGEWPKEWTKLYYKSYPRFNYIELPDVRDHSGPSLESALTGRKSTRDFSEIEMTDISDVSRILMGLQIVPDEMHPEETARRAYPSAGARYPLEAYILPLNVSGLEQRVHHYHVRTHSLGELWSFTLDEVAECLPYETWWKSAGAIVVLTGCHERSAIKYLERAYRYCLIEAGHAAQNICLLSASAGLGCCTYGGFSDEPLIRLLDVNPDEEVPLYMLIVGKPKR